MRTAIYVYKPTTAVIEVAEDGLSVARYPSDHPIAQLARISKLALQPGVYRVLSNLPVSVKGADLEVQSDPTKDPWPDPDPKVTGALVGHVNGLELRAFLASKDIEL